jgi:ribosomal protein S18 acetylase RimI-like enzyme
VIALDLPVGYAVETLTRWNRAAHRRFEEIERLAFDKGLRYTYREMCERAARPGFMALFVSAAAGDGAGDEPGDGAGAAAAVLVIYPHDVGHELYLDTLAVSSPGSGLGALVLQRLIQSARVHYRAIVLDTEETNSIGQRLVEWYSRFGFQIADTSRSSGNVTMRLPLTPADRLPPTTTHRLPPTASR